MGTAIHVVWSEPPSAEQENVDHCSLRHRLPRLASEPLPPTCTRATTREPSGSAAVVRRRQRIRWSGGLCGPRSVESTTKYESSTSQETAVQVVEVDEGEVDDEEVDEQDANGESDAEVAEEAVDEVAEEADEEADGQEANAETVVA